MIWPFLQNLLASLVRYARPYALPLSTGIGILTLSGGLAAFWILAWFSPGAVAYTGNGRIALAAGVFHLWAVAAVVLTARQPPVHATTLLHPVVFAGAFWLLAGNAVAFLVASTLGGFHMYAFSVASMLWALIFALGFPSVASNTKGEIGLLFAPIAGAALLVLLTVVFGILAFFQWTWILRSENLLGDLLLLTGCLVLILAAGAFAKVLLEEMDGKALYAPLLLTKGHLTPEQVGARALSFALQRHPALLAISTEDMFDYSIVFQVAAHGTVQHVNPGFLYDLVERGHGSTEADAFTLALRDHLRRHARFSYRDVHRAPNGSADHCKQIKTHLKDAVEACRRSKHAHLAAIAAAGSAPVPALS